MNDQANTPVQSQLPPILQGADAAPRIFVEGMSQLLLGYPLSRIVLHHSSQPPADPLASGEIRQIACELIIPTIGMLDMARYIIAGASQTQDQLGQIHNDFGVKLGEMIASVAAKADTSQPMK